MRDYRHFIAAFALLLTSCARDFLNPYDSTTPPDAWMPRDLRIDTLGNNAVRLRWQQDERHIDGYTVRRQVSQQVSEFSLSRDSLTFIDVEVVDANVIDTCPSVLYSVSARAGDNLSLALESVPVIFPLTTPANAGPDQSYSDNTVQTTLSANTPSTGETGQWTIISGVGGSLSNANAPDAIFNGQPCTDYVLRWTVTGACGATSDDIEVRFQQQTTQANAGVDVVSQTLTVTLSANLPAQGESGQWSLASGTDGVFSNVSAHDAQFTGQPNLVYLLRWTISGACGATVDDVSVRMPVIDIDGNTYGTVVIGGQEWMTENLRTTRYANGDPIPNVTSNSQWTSLTTGAWAHYNNALADPTYGKLYNWYAATDARNVCPLGWHVPSDTEWDVLTGNLGGTATAGGKMKAVGTQYWTHPNFAATNESGFTALPAGNRHSADNQRGWTGFWWSSTPSGNNTDAWHRLIYYNSAALNRDQASKTRGYSVRCLRD